MIPIPTSIKATLKNMGKWMTRIQKYYDNNKTKHNTILLWGTAGAKLESSWNHGNTVHLMNISITFTFDRCGYSWSVVTPVKYKLDEKDSSQNAATWKLYLTETDLTNGALFTPTPGHGPDWCIPVKSSYPGYFQEPHGFSMGLPEISRANLQVCGDDQDLCDIYHQVTMS